MRPSLRTLRSDAAADSDPSDAPAIFVVIPTKGRASELDATLRAVFNDPPPNLRAIVVNDAPGGEDSPRESVRAVVEARRAEARPLRLVETRGGRGAAAARIAGAEAVKADRDAPSSRIVVEVDDHDTPEPGALRRVALAFRDPRVMAVYGDLYKVAPDGAVVARVRKADYAPGLFLDAGNQAWGMRAYRLSLHDAVGGRRPAETYASEYALFLRFEQWLAQSGVSLEDRRRAIRRIPRPLCRWPVAGDGVSIRHRPEQAEAAERCARLARCGALLDPASTPEGADPVPRRETAEPALLLGGRPVGAFPVLSADQADAAASIVVPCFGSRSYVSAFGFSTATRRETIRPSPQATRSWSGASAGASPRRATPARATRRAGICACSTRTSRSGPVGSTRCWPSCAATRPLARAARRS